MRAELLWTQARPTYELVVDGEATCEVSLEDLRNDPISTINRLLGALSTRQES